MTTIATLPVQGSAAIAESIRALAAVSMLHESDGGSATRMFGSRAVLRRTVDRLSESRLLTGIAVLCWDEQVDAAQRAIEETHARISIVGPRTPLAAMDAVTTARRWSDGWRGGLLGACAFDAGFHAQSFLDAATAADADAVVLVDASWGLIDPALIDALITHAGEHDDQPICFCPATPGLGTAILRIPHLRKLAAATGIGVHPGRALHYHPAQLSREMLGGDACVPVATLLARTRHKLTLHSDRQVRWLQAALGPADAIYASGATGEELIERLNDGVTRGRRNDAETRRRADAGTIKSFAPSSLAPSPRPRVSASFPIAAPTPRDVVLELTTTRRARPIFWPGRGRAIERAAMTMDTARRLIDELSVLDDTRLTLAGVGDPLCSPLIFDVIAAAHSAGIAVNVQTDLIGLTPDEVRGLARSSADIVSVHLPAMSPAIYQEVMGVNEYANVLRSIEKFVQERALSGRALPLLAPLFVKCRQNLAEMESWYDQWLRAVGAAVIIGPSDFGGLIESVAAADMTPPMRRPCARLNSRMTVLSDGRIASCEEDVLGKQVFGQAGIDQVVQVWSRSFAALRQSHAIGEWGSKPACAGCREWHRP